MSIIIGHYHLHPGGVTRIIDSQIRSLKQNFPDTEIKVITGHTEDTTKYKKFGIPVLTENNLNYLSTKNLDSDTLSHKLSEIEDFLKSTVKRNDILHFHNINLGKNPLLTFAIYHLAQKGYNVFNHAHDFAEDRPSNMEFNQFIIENHLETNTNEVLYPKNMPNYGYGVINSFDRERLLQFNLGPERIAYLPNPVIIPPEALKLKKSECRKTILRKLHLDEKTNIITYPVRVIRRKNIGEFILLSELFGPDYTFLVTLAPKNPIEIKPYLEWKNFCKSHQISQVHFEVGKEINFHELVKGSDFSITTSYREGFGMAFMEPWLYDTPVVGRDIPEVTRDFMQNGVTFHNLYTQLKIPGKEKDFIELSMEEQMHFIAELKNDNSLRKQLETENQKVKKIFTPRPTEEIDNNKEAIVKNYSFENYGKKIMDTYRTFFGKP